MNLKDIDLEAMRNVDVRTVDRATLKDIRDVVIDMSLTQEERFVDFIRQIGNPYCYKCGEMVIKITFATNTTDTLEDKLRHYIASMY